MKLSAEQVFLIGTPKPATEMSVPVLWLPSEGLQVAPCTRRDVLRYAGMIVGGSALAGLWGPYRQRAQGEPIVAFLAAAAFTAAIGWFVTKVLDNTVGKLFDKAELKDVKKPEPAPGDKYTFHNTMAASWEVANVSVDCTWSKQYKTYLAVNKFLRTDIKKDMRGWFDYNTRELVVMKALQEGKKLDEVLFPYDCRREPNDHAKELFNEACNDLKIEKSALHLDYERKFSESPEGEKVGKKKFLALGVSDKNDSTKTSVLFVDESKK